MLNKKKNNQCQYIEQLLKIASKKKTLSKSELKTEAVWDTDCPPGAFSAHPDAYKSIIYKSINK